MKGSEFKKLWPQVQGKPCNVGYGKQTFYNVVLTEYNEQLATVKTAMQGTLNTRSIKSIDLVDLDKLKGKLNICSEEERQNLMEAACDEIALPNPIKVIEIKAEEMPRLLPPKGFDPTLHFEIFNSGGHWKKARIMVDGVAKQESDADFAHAPLIQWCVSKGGGRGFILDTTGPGNAYYEIVRGTAFKIEN
jgi:hypothetical protein